MTTKYEGIMMVPVTEIMKRVNDTMDGYQLSDGPDEWFRMIRNKMDDPQTPAIIRAIEEHGFISPVCIEDEGPRGWYFGNGHHRLCVAVLLGLDEILVDFTGSYTRSSVERSHSINDDYQDHDAALAEWISATACKIVK